MSKKVVLSKKSVQEVAEAVVALLLERGFVTAQISAKEERDFGPNYWREVSGMNTERTEIPENVLLSNLDNSESDKIWNTKTWKFRAFQNSIPIDRFPADNEFPDWATIKHWYLRLGFSSKLTFALIDANTTPSGLEHRIQEEDLRSIEGIGPKFEKLIIKRYKALKGETDAN